MDSPDRQRSHDDLLRQPRRGLYDWVISRMKERLIRRVLEHTGDDPAWAASILGLPPDEVFREQWPIEEPGPTGGPSPTAGSGAETITPDPPEERLEDGRDPWERGGPDDDS